MKPKLKSYPDLERAVELIRIGKVRGRKGIERIIMRCFTKKMLASKTKRGGQYSPNRGQNRDILLLGKRLTVVALFFRQRVG